MFLQKNRIEEPYYHGGLYNGKAMNKLMMNSQAIMEDTEKVILEISREERCSDEEVNDTAETIYECSHSFYSLFTTARAPSGLITEVSVDKLHSLTELALCLWRGLDLSVTPIVHSIEDHWHIKSGA